jgi:hypothetical protein
LGKWLIVRSVESAAPVFCRRVFSPISGCVVIVVVSLRWWPTGHPARMGSL